MRPYLLTMPKLTGTHSADYREKQMNNVVKKVPPNPLEKRIGNSKLMCLNDNLEPLNR